MSSRMQSSDASNQSLPAGGIVALPSLSCSLSSLPQAMSMDSVSVHPTMYAQRAAESQAKLQKALSKTASSFSPQNPPIVPAYMRPPPRDSHSPGSSSPPLMMVRKPVSPLPPRNSGESSTGPNHAGVRIQQRSKLQT